MKHKWILLLCLVTWLWRSLFFMTDVKRYFGHCFFIILSYSWYPWIINRSSNLRILNFLKMGSVCAINLLLSINRTAFFWSLNSLLMLVKLPRMLLYQASRPNDKWGWTKALYICFNVHDCSSGLTLLIIANNWAIFLHFSFVFFFQFRFLSIHIPKNVGLAL